MVKYKAKNHYNRRIENMGILNRKNKDTTSSLNGNSILKISVTNDGTEYTFFLEGRLDTITSPNLDSKINEVINGATKITMDLAKLEYISSAGLRVLLGALQAMEDKGEMVVCNLTAPVREIFELTGFANLFNIK
jgi:anti-sigma B factor antagonist